ncbi:unnamed protein product [Mytilus coruscus]|uniref:Uncharacterized protein n=1 Tax=Mytilus coruscus TaxID=42192 RepID=A0A6J8AX19_MYTCO|nr:unnamed protein product [Mytilus coruscus]
MYPYIVDPENLKTIIAEQGHLLDKDDEINILTREKEDTFVLEPYPGNLKTIIAEQGHLLDKDGELNILTREKEDTFVLEPFLEIIAIKFNATSSKESQSVTWMQLKSKWQKLETKFKQIEEKNRKSGEGTHSYKYMEEMKEAVGDNSNIPPAKTISSMDLSCEVKKTEKEGKGKQPRKRKANELADSLGEIKREREDRYERFESMVKEINKERLGRRHLRMDGFQLADGKLSLLVVNFEILWHQTIACGLNLAELKSLIRSVVKKDFGPTINSSDSNVAMACSAPGEELVRVDSEERQQYIEKITDKNKVNPANYKVTIYCVQIAPLDPLCDEHFTACFVS